MPTEFSSANPTPSVPLPKFVSAEPTPPERPAWRKRFAAFRYIPKLAGLVWETSRSLSLTMLILRALRALTPIAQLWVGRNIINAVYTSLSTHVTNWPHIWRLVGLEIGIVIAAELLARGQILVESLLGDLFTNRISVRIMAHAASLDLAQFENPEYQDLLERARRETVTRIGMLTQILAIAQDMVTLVSLIAGLVIFNPWLVLLLVGTILPSLVGQTHFAGLAYSLLFRFTPQRRMLDYLRYVGASDRTAKEVQMLGLAPWLTNRYRVLADEYYQQNKKLSKRKAVVSALLSLIGTLGHYSAYVLILVATVRGKVSFGDLTFLSASFAQSRDLIQRFLIATSEVYEQALYLRDLFAFFDIKPTIVNRPNARPVPRPIQQGFVFDNVGFRYPDGDRWAVRHVTFALRPGERIALVGENGAGKTTITKLLARLYDPTEGRIYLDGVDLREYEVNSLRQAIGVIFQDFVRYDMRFDENIGVGRIDEARPYLEAVVASNGSGPKMPLYEPIVLAAEDSLASTLLPRLPKGYGQMLGRRFEDGVDLSGGEWQKVALARAYLRDAQLLILDEPTAALDARAEFDVFVRFSEITKGRMAVLISHRFSTVRMADRILVLQHGRITEHGTHAELIAKGGLYAELFHMQAAGYR
ncbi:MAG TPA: ABC transporter ATP-binding protein [Gemmatimonadaceae bacterium]|jgi:ATP-binding cassette subfamily B protein|nr:ABC transporter ATP-binding protein [Gemmatimonadaceae bacterium]